MNKFDGAFRTISEAAEDLDVPKHVLRFWETKFPAIKPMKRGGGRRYYRPEDVELLFGIRHLLYASGLTIKGVQRVIREQGADFVKNVWRTAGTTGTTGTDGGTTDKGIASAAAKVAKPAAPPELAVRFSTAPARGRSSGAKSASRAVGSGAEFSARQLQLLRKAMKELESAKLVLERALRAPS